jgi:glyceraldehyde-3-phosphate dehydrogenase/erythrose-4-phosphate dehydrogenase
MTKPDLLQGQAHSDPRTEDYHEDQDCHFAERDPKNLPWGDLGIDIVMECTGIFTDKEKAQIHLETARAACWSPPRPRAPTRPSSTA